MLQNNGLVMKPQENSSHDSDGAPGFACSIILLSLLDRGMNSKSEQPVTLKERPKQTGLFQRHSVSQFCLFIASLSKTDGPYYFKSYET